MIMNQFKKCKVLLLPTKEKENGMLCIDATGIDKSIYIKSTGMCEHSDYVAQHLYILSDDKIEDGDWVYHAASGTIFKFDLKDETITLGYEKVIATTDKSLKIGGIWNDLSETVEEFVNSKQLSSPDAQFNLPQPSEAFIKKYIDAYNKREIITDVLVEYELYKLSNSGNTADIIENGHHGDLYRLKINPKDNTIAIKKIKDSWTREELLEKFNYDSLRNRFHSQNEMFINKKTAYLIIQWIEENL